MNQYKPVQDIPELSISDALLLNEAAKVIVQRRAYAFDNATEVELSEIEMAKLQRKIHATALQQNLLKLSRRAGMVAAGFFLVVMLGLGGYQKVEAFRLLVNGVYCQVFPQYTNYHFQNGDELLKNPKEVSTGTKGRELKLKSGGVLSWGVPPEGYLLDRFTDFPAFLSIIFRNTSDKISFKLWSTTVGVVLDTEDADVSEIMIGESPAQLICKDKSVSLVWVFDEKVYVLLATNLEKDTLITFAESLKIS